MPNSDDILYNMHSNDLIDALHGLLSGGHSVQAALQAIALRSIIPNIDTRMSFIVKDTKTKHVRVPSPECLEANLPKDRPFTREDVAAAWKACLTR